MMSWLQDEGHPDIYHRNGVWDMHAPLPHRWHRCRAWTRAFFDGDLVERCPCGGIRYNDERWYNKNARRAYEREKAQKS